MPSPTSARSRRALGAAASACTAALVLAACSAAAQVAHGAGPGTGTVAATSPATSATASKATPSSAPVQHLSPPKGVGLAWHAAGSLVGGHPATYVARTDGGAVGLLWIDTRLVSFRLVPGWKVPEGGPARAADNMPNTWVPRMVAAFNGGFLLADHVGGYYYAHRMVRPLVNGLAALAISADGRLTVGRWGRDLTLTPRTVAVRQNLPLLVDHSRSQTKPTDGVSTWGQANGSIWTANRSALGELPDGSLVYAYGHDVRPATMAAALVDAGVQRGMVLDMNKSWPGGFVYWHGTGGTRGQRIQPQEYHDPSVYFARYTKDFVAVLRR